MRVFKKRNTRNIVRLSERRVQFGSLERFQREIIYYE